jgi:ligand-binding sensor domain-containing protein
MKKLLPGGRVIFYIYVFIASGLNSCLKADKDAINPQTLDKWEYFTKSDGLPENFVWSLLEDSQGRIWIGTLNEGIAMYDGTTFTKYNTGNVLHNNSILCIYEDRDGLIWFGTYEGISIYEDGEFTNYPTIAGSSIEIYDIIQDNGGLYWFGTGYYGVLFYNGSSFSQYLDESCYECNLINILFEDSNNRLWVGSEGDLKIVETDGDFESYGVGDELPGVAITSVYEDKSGAIWIGSRDGTTVSKYRNNKFEKISLYNSGGQNWVTSIVQLNSGELWFGTIFYGLIYFDGILMQSRFQESGLPDNTILSMIRDREGNIWMGTSEGGAAKYVPR